MRSVNEQPKAVDGTFYRELRLLEEVDSSPDQSQRQLAHRLGIALGVANLLVRSLARKGYIRMTRLGWRRWAYALTPAGVARKLHLTVAYIERFVDHYRRVRLLLREDLSQLPLNTESRVAILGTTEVAELVYLALKDLGVEDIEVFDTTPTVTKFLGMRVQALESMVPAYYSKVVIAAAGNTDKLRGELAACGVSGSQIVEMLNASRRELGSHRQGAA